MSKVFINVSFVSKMIFHINGWGVPLPWNPLIAWVCVDLEFLEHVHPRGCIRHLNIIINYKHVWICITTVKWLNLANYQIKQQSWKWNVVFIKEFKGSCWSWSSFDTMGLLPNDLLSSTFSSTLDIESLDNTFFLYNATRLVPGVHKKFRPIWRKLVLHFDMDKWVWILISFTWLRGTHLRQNWWVMGVSVHPPTPIKSHHSCGNKLMSFIGEVLKKGPWLWTKPMKPFKA